MWGIFSGEFQCLPVDDCSAVSCDSGVLTRGSESTSFYSAILVQALVLFMVSFAVQNRLSFIRSHLFIFVFISIMRWI